jgi:hypothetical protein
MIDSFDPDKMIDKTLRIMQEDGFDSYLPTLIYGDKVLVLEGVPPIHDSPGQSHKAIAEQWIAKVRPSLPYLIIYLDGPDWAYAVYEKGAKRESWYIERNDGSLRAGKIDIDAE